MVLAGGLTGGHPQGVFDRYEAEAISGEQLPIVTAALRKYLVDHDPDDGDVRANLDEMIAYCAEAALQHRSVSFGLS
jgi:hypothetical protein